MQEQTKFVVKKQLNDDLLSRLLTKSFKCGGGINATKVRGKLSLSVRKT